MTTEAPAPEPTPDLNGLLRRTADITGALTLIRERVRERHVAALSALIDDADELIEEALDILLADPNTEDESTWSPGISGTKDS